MIDEKKGWDFIENEDEEIFKKLESIVRKRTKKKQKKDDILQDNKKSKPDNNIIRKYGYEHYQFVYGVFDAKSKKYKTDEEREFYLKSISAHQKVKLETESNTDKTINFVTLAVTVIAFSISALSNVAKQENLEDLINFNYLFASFMFLVIIFLLIRLLWEVFSDHSQNVFYDQIISRICEEGLSQEYDENDKNIVDSSQNCGK